MSLRIETQECFPKTIDGFLRDIPPPEPNHEACPGGHHVEGLIGGWYCPCECHQQKISWRAELDPTKKVGTAEVEEDQGGLKITYKLNPPPIFTDKFVDSMEETMKEFQNWIMTNREQMWKKAFDENLPNINTADELQAFCELTNEHIEKAIQASIDRIFVTNSEE